MTNLSQSPNSPPVLFPQSNDLNTQELKFKDDILGLISQLETRLNNKIEYYHSHNLSSKTNYESGLLSINTKNDQMSQSIASMSVKLDHLSSFEAFSRKANDQIITQEIRVNNLSKDLTKACYKYDKIYMDNLILPGYIGDCCKFKTLRDFFDDVITQLVQLHSSKEKQSIEIKGCKDRLESVIQNFNNQVSGLNKTSMKFTNDAIKECEVTMRDMLNGVNDQINELNLDNSKHIVGIRKQCRELNDEWKKIEEIKNKIVSKSASDVECVQKMILNTKNSFECFKQEFHCIKTKFGELLTFIKDVGFKKNLKGDVKKKDITAIVKKLNFKRSESLDVLSDGIKGTMPKQMKIPMTQKGKKKLMSHEVESRLKKYINGETDIDHLNQSTVNKMKNDDETDHERDMINNISIDSNNKIIHELGAELEQSNCKILNESVDKENYNMERELINESPIPTQSYSCKQINTTIQMNMNNGSIIGDINNINANNTNTNGNGNITKNIVKRHYSLDSFQVLLNQNEKKKDKKENKDIDSKILNPEKMVYDLQSSTTQKINELSRQIDLLLNLNGFSSKINGYIQPIGNNYKTSGNRLNKNKNNQKYEVHKDQDMSLSFSNKVVPMSVIDLIKRNNFPIPNIQNMSSTLGNTSLVVKPRVKARIKTGREPINKILMQTFGVNYNNNNYFNDDSNTSSTIRDNQFSPYLKDSNYKTGFSSLNNLADFRVANKKEKKQLINFDSKITPGKYISLQKLLNSTTQTNSNPDMNNN